MLGPLSPDLPQFGFGGRAIDCSIADEPVDGNVPILARPQVAHQLGLCTRGPSPILCFRDPVVDIAVIAAAVAAQTEDDSLELRMFGIILWNVRKVLEVLGG